MRVLSIGEVLWDVFPDQGTAKGQEHLGGAPLNFAANIVRLGGHASILTGLGQDQRGRIAQETMVFLGVGTDFVQRTPDRANASRCGVGMSLQPWKPTSA